MIYVTVGTMFLDFPRLIRAIDQIAIDSGEPAIVQTGMGQTVPAHCEHFGFRSREAVLAIQRDARVVVCHAGIGCVSDALNLRRPLIVVPRLKRYKEHMNDHQLDLARAVERRGWGRMILDIHELADACAHPPEAHADYAPARESLIDAVRDFVEETARKKVRGER